MSLFKDFNCHKINLVTGNCTFGHIVESSQRYWYVSIRKYTLCIRCAHTLAQMRGQEGPPLVAQNCKGKA